VTYPGGTSVNRSWSCKFVVLVLVYISNPTTMSFLLSPDHHTFCLGPYMVSFTPQVVAPDCGSCICSLCQTSGFSLLSCHPFSQFYSFSLHFKAADVLHSPLSSSRQSLPCPCLHVSVGCPFCLWINLSHLPVQQGSLSLRVLSSFLHHFFSGIRGHLNATICVTVLLV